jgi:beta-xylosidase
MDRYGAEEVVTWPVEVWNEPNLPGFWEKADMQEYFRLFQESFEAVKAVDSRFRVGGPAVCGGSDRIWIKSFMEFCRENKIPVDFVTRHHYATKFPDNVGHYGYAELLDPENPEDGFAGLHSTREIIDSFPEYKGLEIHITEFNTSYIPNCPLHDTNQNAAYIAHQLSRLGDDNESYSYWTFGDIFEERGVPFTPFHGGFGLVANGCIPKPTFWTFAFYKQLKEKAGHCVYRDDNCVVIKTGDGGYRGVCWNMTLERSGKDVELNFTFDADTKNYSLLTKRVDEEGTNPLKVWHDLGEPANLTAEQTKLLQMAAWPRVSTEQKFESYGKLDVSFKLEENAVVYFELEPRKESIDRGYSYDRTMQFPATNPLTRTDYPDVDVIRVEDTYYMVSTTMYFMPGCEILRSYDLVHWEHAAFVYDRLDSTPAQCLQEGNAYGKGMWAASLRYHKGKFYVCFVANDTHKTYLYTADKVEGPWEKHNIEGFYHDCSLLFDDDGRTYIVYGGRYIHLTELKEDLSGPKPGGLDRIVVKDADGPFLGYEGAHFYKINGKYYLFFIHSLQNEWKRTEACFVSDSLEGEFVGGDILNDDMGYCNAGVAQGGIVDTPDGKWYAVLFQDRGAVGRIPVLVPMTWENDYPVFGENGRVPLVVKTNSTRPEHTYEPLVGSDNFKGEEGLSEEDAVRKYGSFGFKSAWQFNHEPELSLVHHDKDKGMLWLETDSICDSLVKARNTLTQRMLYPGCAAEVTVDISKLKDGDYAGLCVLQSCYGFVAVTKRNGKAYVVMQNKEAAKPGMTDYNEDDLVKEWEAVEIEGDSITLKVTADFTNMKDTAKFLYKKGWGFNKIGTDHKMYFKLDHFTGYRFGLFMYSTKEAGGRVGFSNFVYKER